MILKENSSDQKLRGAYYTPLPLANMMINLFKNDINIKNILEPSCGDGVFIDILIETEFIDRIKQLDAVEIDEKEAKKLQDRMKVYKNIKVSNQDFFEFYVKNYSQKKYDLILGNPPYIRYQYLEEEQRIIMSNILKRHGMKSNKLINTWVGFLVTCVHMLSKNGRIAFVIPTDIMQVSYAEDLRLFLSKIYQK